MYPLAETGKSRDNPHWGPSICSSRTETWISWKRGSEPRSIVEL